MTPLDPPGGPRPPGGPPPAEAPRDPPALDPVGRAVLGGAAFAVLVGALLAAPVLFGAVTPWAWAGLLVALALAGVAAWAAGGEPLTRAPLVPWAAPAALVVGLQLVPLPPGVLRVVAPASHAAFAGDAAGADAARRADAAGGADAARPRWQASSFDRPATHEAALKATLYLLAFFVAARTASTPGRARALLGALLVIGCFETFYGLVEQFSGSGRIFGWSKPSAFVRARASGTYVNPNHFAALLAMGIPAAIALAASDLLRAGPLPRDRWRAALTLAAHPDTPKRALLLFAVVVLAAGVTASLSRGGIASAVLGVAAAGAVVSRARLAGVVAPLGAAAVVLGGAAVGLERLLERFRGLSDLGAGAGEPSAAARVAYTLDTLDLAWRSPLLGVGAGAFEPALLRLHPEHTGVEHAHDDYAQLLAELGLVAAVALLLGVALTARQALLADPGPERRRLAHVCLAALVPLAAHSLVDFNLHIPANALWAAALLGAAWGLSRAPGPPPAPDRLRAALGVGGLVAALGAATLAVPIARADWEARPEVERAAPDERPLPVQVAALERALAIWPGDARRWGDLAATRWQAARQAEAEAARTAAADLAGPLATTATLAELELRLLSIRLRTSSALEAAAERALVEARRAMALAPGDPRWRAIVTQVEQERPRR